MISARLCLGLVACLSAHAQATARPVFEVASVKPSQSAEPARLTSNAGTWSCTNCSLFDLLGHAYKVFEYQLITPDWARSARFDVVAKLPPGFAPASWGTPADVDQFALMMQSLLIDRFKMEAHREKRELPVYELVIAKDGSKLKELSAPAPAPEPGPTVDKDGFPTIPGGSGMKLLGARGRMQFRWQTMEHVAHFISTQVDRPVVDMTGLTGHYALTLSWYRETARAPLAPRPDDAQTGNDPVPGPTIFEAVQDQLGLKLQPKKGLIEMVVIDRVEKTPVEN